MRRPWTAAVVLPFLFACGTHTRGPRRPRETVRIELGAVDVESVAVGRGGDDGTVPALEVALTPEASRRVESVTTAHVGEKVSFVVDGEVVMEPRIRDPIVGGRLEITGPTEDELREMQARLSSSDGDPPPGE